MKFGIHDLLFTHCYNHYILGWSSQFECTSKVTPSCFHKVNLFRHSQVHRRVVQDDHEKEYQDVSLGNLRPIWRYDCRIRLLFWCMELSHQVTTLANYFNDNVTFLCVFITYTRVRIACNFSCRVYRPLDVKRHEKYFWNTLEMSVYSLHSIAWRFTLLFLSFSSSFP